MKDQYSFILSALKEMAEGKYPLWNANRLVISLFSYRDLLRARNPTPPCMTQISFYPVKEKSESDSRLSCPVHRS